MRSSPRPQGGPRDPGEPESRPPGKGRVGRGGGGGRSREQVLREPRWRHRAAVTSLRAGARLACGRLASSGAGLRQVFSAARRPGGSARPRYGASGTLGARRAAPGHPRVPGNRRTASVRCGRVGQAAAGGPSRPRRLLSCPVSRERVFTGGGFAGQPAGGQAPRCVKTDGTSLTACRWRFLESRRTARGRGGATVPAPGTPALRLGRPGRRWVLCSAGARTPRSHLIRSRRRKAGLNLPEVLREPFRSVWSMNGPGKMDFGRAWDVAMVMT